MSRKQSAVDGWRLHLCVALVLCPTLGNPTASLAQGLQRAAVLLPILPGERERWAQPRPEPVTLDLPGWTMQSFPPDTSLPNQRIIGFTRDTCDVQLLRFWDYALTDGGPMSLKLPGRNAMEIESRSTISAIAITAPKRITRFSPTTKPLI